MLFTAGFIEKCLESCYLKYQQWLPLGDGILCSFKFILTLLCITYIIYICICINFIITKIYKALFVLAEEKNTGYADKMLIDNFKDSFYSHEANGILLVDPKGGKCPISQVITIQELFFG